jgi:serine/threonine protein phosphatase PrpC
MASYQFESTTIPRSEIEIKLTPNTDKKFKRKRPSKDFVSFDSDNLIAIVADGISSCNSGLQAAYNAVNWSKLYMSRISERLKDGFIKKEEIEERIITILQFTNKINLNLSETMSEFNGWGTTLDSCLIYNNTAHIGHIGDGRVYYHANNSNNLIKITNDHSEYIPEIDKLPEYEKQLYEMRLRISNYVGKKDIDVDYVSQPINKGDTLFMTTDGVTKSLTEKTLCHLINKYKNPKELNEAISDILLWPSVYIPTYAKQEVMSINNASIKLIDDSSYIIIKRME